VEVTCGQRKGLWHRRFFDGQNLTVMDSHHAIVNNKQTLATNKHQHKCASRRLLVATAVTLMLMKIIGIGQGVSGAGGKSRLARRGQSASQSETKFSIRYPMPTGVQVPPRLNYLLRSGGLGTVEAPRGYWEPPCAACLGWGGGSRPSAANALPHYHIRVERLITFK